MSVPEYVIEICNKDPQISKAACLDSMGFPVTRTPLPVPGSPSACLTGKTGQIPARSWKEHKVSIKGQDVPVHHMTSYLFATSGGDVKITGNVTVDINQVPGLILHYMQAEVPPSTYTDRYQARHESIRVQDSRLVVSMDVNYENWADICAKCVPCPTLSEPLRMCDANNKKLEKEVGISVSVTPTVAKTKDGYTLTLEPAGYLDERGGMPWQAKILRNIFDWVGEGHHIDNRYAEAIRDVQEGLRAVNELQLAETLQTANLDAFKPVLSDPRFVVENDRYRLKMMVSAVVPAGASCSLFNILAAANNYHPGR